MQLPKTPGSPLILQKTTPKNGFSLISRERQEISKKFPNKSCRSKFYIRMTCHFFVIDKVKLEKSMQMLQTAGGRRGREAGPGVY